VAGHALAHHHPLAHALPLFLAAGVLLTSLDTTAKYLVREHSLILVVWARYAGQMLVVTPFTWHRAGSSFWRTRHLPLQLARSACLLIATICFFSALRFLPLAEASAITFLAPMFIVLLSQPLLGERPTRARWAAVVLGFAGIVVLLRPGSAVFHPAAILLIVAALSNALYQLLTRKLVGDSAHTTLFYSALVGAVGVTLALPFAFEGGPMTLFASALLLLTGFLAGTAHYLLTRAYLIAPASLLTPFTYLQMVWATIFGYLVFQHLPDRWSFAGMAIIVGSGIMLWFVERRRARLMRSFP
jgi:drug/metabolite transporter (DMT)-like permease